ncbi:MAG: FHA domain-containing protein [Thermoanaerobaculia bacterium]
MAKSAKSVEPGVLDELNRLSAERGPIAGWLAGLEASRERVSEAVYRRVHEDYSKRIAGLDRLARPLRLEATRTVALLDTQLAELATGKQDVELDLQEIALRHRLEEYSESEFESRAQGPRERIAEQERELEKIRATRELWLAARGEEIADTVADTIAETDAPETADPRPPAPAVGATALFSVAPAPPPAPLPSQFPLPSMPPIVTPAAMDPMATLPSMSSSPSSASSPPSPPSPPSATPATPPTPPIAPPAPPAPASVRLSPASITMPRIIPPPRPSSPAIPAAHIAEAAARTVVHLSGLGPPASMAPVAPLAPLTPAASTPPASPARAADAANLEPVMDRTIIFSPTAPEPVPDPAAFSRPVKATLVPVDIADGSAGGHALAEQNTLGRVPGNSLQIQQGSVSRHHATLRRTPEGWMLEDLKAENGTWVNGERIEKRRLSDGDRVNIGTVRFIFRIG